MDRTGVTDTHITACVKGRRDIGDDMAESLEQGMKKPTGWMDSHPPESGPAQAAESHPVSLAPITVPLLISWEYVVSNKQVPEHFTLAMPDDALADRVPRGTRMIFSATLSPRPGAGILVEDQTGRRYVRRYAEAPGGAWIAQATSSAYASLHSERDGLVLLAVVAWVEAALI